MIFPLKPPFIRDFPWPKKHGVGLPFSFHIGFHDLACHTPSTRRLGDEWLAFAQPPLSQGTEGTESTPSKCRTVPGPCTVHSALEISRNHECPEFHPGGISGALLGRRVSHLGFGISSIFETHYKLYKPLHLALISNGCHLIVASLKPP